MKIENYGRSFTVTTIKDISKKQLERRIREMKKRGFVLISVKKVFHENYGKSYYYAKLKNTRAK